MQEIISDPKRQPVKKKTCKCIEYKKEIDELYKLIEELRVKESELNKLKSTFTDISYGDTSANKFSLSEIDSIIFPTLKRIENGLDQFDNKFNKFDKNIDLDQESIKQIFDPKLFNKENIFDNLSFNNAFNESKFLINKDDDLRKIFTELTEQEQKNINEQFNPILFTNHKNEFNNTAFNEIFTKSKWSPLIKEQYKLNNSNTLNAIYDKFDNIP